MLRRVTILYIIVWVVYAAFTVIAFPMWSISVAIPHFLLLGFGAWIYGTSRCLVIMIPVMFFHIYLLSFMHADILNWYQSKATGPLINILLIELLGNLRLQLDRIKETNERLDHLVDQRNTALALLTAQLLENSENIRIAHGQELHDGVGQQLTGVQLLSSSLAYQLENEGCPLSAAAYNLSMTTRKAHNHIRRIARTLFPIRIAQVGLLAALNELAACINEIRTAHILVKELSDSSSLPESVILQLYRICQESCTYLIDQCNANLLEITLNTSAKSYILGVAHNGRLMEMKKNTSLCGLIQYRLKQIGGKQSQSKTINGRSTIYYEVPKKQLQRDS